MQSSSDHVSTHVSYAGLFVDKLDREALVRALRERRDLRGDRQLSRRFSDGRAVSWARPSNTRQPEATESVHSRHGRARQSVALVKNNRVIYSKPGAGAEMTFSYTDAEAPAGSAYYYLRVEQKNGQLPAWSSPIWVKYN